LSKYSSRSFDQTERDHAEARERQALRDADGPQHGEVRIGQAVRGVEGDDDRADARRVGQTAELRSERRAELRAGGRTDREADEQRREQCGQFFHPCPSQIRSHRRGRHPSA
jgi:hypothetical protein